MQIPLDYYRILGLPIQATDDQLQYAHRDRMLQLPRREYSEVAIAARRQLIDEAYEVLSDPAQRQAYDAKFLASSYANGDNGETEAAALGQGSGEGAGKPVAPPLPSIEIEDNQLIGALLVLLELGEYELVLKLGRPYLSSGSSSLESGQYGDPAVVGADIVLTLALACLELGREQWHQGQYENAAESLETGLDLLMKEGLFAGVRGEMQTELFKLRPYRILELLALPDEQEAERYRGFQLLQAMLRERGGIDGSGDDRSGLSTDDFLRFIQQLRSYLTVAEQQTLFEQEARRPSAVAAYLAVYALIAGGFAYQQPALVQQAKSMLLGLSARQDVSLEFAVCALLLGQTNDASSAVEQTQEADVLSIIRRHSQDSPDLLPGLCFYAEQWLQRDVFPYFRDLAPRTASLKAYFANPTVQAYLEKLPEESQTTLTASSRNGTSTTILERPKQVTQARSHARTAAAVGAPQRSDASLQVAERVARPAGRNRRGRPTPTQLTPSASDLPEAAGPTKTRGLSKSRGSGPRLDRLLLLGGAALLVLLLLWVILNRFFSWLDQQFANPLAGEQLEIILVQPVVTIPEPESPPPIQSAPEGELTQAAAESVVQNWFAAKTEALGEDHNINALNRILTGELLNERQTRAANAEADGVYGVYDYPNLEILSVDWSEETPDLASIDVAVTEEASFFNADGTPNPGGDYVSDLQVRYSLVREADQWKIEAIELL
ncbi:MAG: IMS domain-containing protein [Elainellaceae cyanobacterium]